jgi:hypothetical protein
LGGGKGGLPPIFSTALYISTFLTINIEKNRFSDKAENGTFAHYF